MHYKQAQEDAKDLGPMLKLVYDADTEAQKVRDSTEKLTELTGFTTSPRRKLSRRGS